MAGAAGLRNFRSPIPYLFGGLALMLSVIAIALLIIACSYRKQQYSSSSGDEEKQPSNKVMVDMEPKIVVIMAGESNPTYLAKPLSTIEQAIV
ncbi:hypothetical protein SESBI_04930 [Sesbania bispinosa]|nr:hypothetical protein SESBI_04930 [Sesbania bispinosa]